MSNEFLMVPRELLERYVSSVEGHGYGFDGDEEIRTLLDKPAMHQGEPVAWRYQTHAGGLWYLSSSEHNARMFENAEKGSRVEPLYTHADPGEVERKLEDQRREFSHAQAVEHRKWADLVDSLKARQSTLHDLLQRAYDADQAARHLQPYNVSKLMDEIEAVLDASAEPSAPKCTYCGDTGQIMVGRSGDANDGNAPIMELCEDCDGPSAPTEDDYLPEGIIEAAINGQIIDLPSWPVEIDERADGKCLDGGDCGVGGSCKWCPHARAALERKPS